MQQNWYLVKIHSYEFIECVFTKEQCLELLSFNLSNSLNFISTSTHFLQVLCLFWKNKYFKASIYDIFFLFH